MLDLDFSNTFSVEALKGFFFRVRLKFFSRFCYIFLGFCPQTPCFSRSGPVFPGFPGAVGTLHKSDNCLEEVTPPHHATQVGTDSAKAATELQLFISNQFQHLRRSAWQNLLTPSPLFGQFHGGTCILATLAFTRRGRGEMCVGLKVRSIWSLVERKTVWNHEQQTSLVQGPFMSSGLSTFCQRCWHWTSERSTK